MKTKNNLLALFITLLFLTQNSFATGNLTVSEELIINNSADEVWNAIGSFGGLHSWHPAVTETKLTGNGTDAGDTRVLILGDGATITEVLVDHNQTNMAYSYVITSGPFPVTGYYSKIKVVPNGKKSKVVWSSSFDSKGVEDAKAIETIKGVYTAGFNALNTKLNKKK